MANEMFINRRRATLFASLLTSATVVGCAGRPALFPNSDKSLRRSSAQFAADSAKRHPYKADVPKAGEANGRAQVGYVVDQLEIANLSDEDWSDLEIWVNESYVVHVDTIRKGTLKTLNFQMLFDANGNYFPTNNMKTLVRKVDMLKDGKMYSLRVQLAD
jgi:hypothetical protein